MQRRDGTDEKWDFEAFNMGLRAEIDGGFFIQVWVDVRVG